MAKVGFIGLGIMGAPMARNILKGGHSVKGYDISQSALNALIQEGATGAASAQEAAAGSDIVITMLPNSGHVESAVFGDQGVATGMQAGDDALFIDMSTILPAMTDRVAQGLAEKGIAMVDAPVGRTSQHAIDGELLIMAGGDDEHIERARPVLECMGEIIVCGKVGSGSRMKIVNNYLAIASNVLTAEALTMAEALGLNVDLAKDVLCGTTAGRGHLNTTYPAQVLAGNLDPGFMIKLADKDMGLALETAGQINAPAAMGSVSRQMMSIAKIKGRGDQDWTAIYEVVRELAGLKAEGENF